MKKWFSDNKILLIIFAIASLVLLVITYFQLNYLMQNLADLQHYAETGTISEQLSKYGTLGITNLIVFGIWAILVMVVMWKIIFPTKESAKNAFLINEIEYLFKLPSDIRRGLKK